jgi:penicillin-binding protein 1A
MTDQPSFPSKTGGARARPPRTGSTAGGEGARGATPRHLVNAISQAEEADRERVRRRLDILKKTLKLAALATAAAAVIAAAAVVLAIRAYEADLPDSERLRTGYDPPQVTRVLARDGTLLASLFTERRTLVGFEKVPRHAKLAFLAAEDAHFYEHEGLNYFGMLRALWANLRAGRTVQGGSTITQQVVKNVLLDPERTYDRKIRETLLARRVEQQLSKDELFGLYLNHIYLGHGRYGVEEASRHYFGKSVSEIDLAESALLAGLVAAPERFSPRKSAAAALKRRRYVLDQMWQKGFLTDRTLYERTLKAPLRLAPAAEAEAALCPEVVSRANQLLESIAPARAHRGGFTVHTTIDPTLEAYAREAVRKNLDAYAERHRIKPPFEAERNKLWGPAFEGSPRRFGIYVGSVVAHDDQSRTLDVRVGEVVGRVFLAHEQRYNPQNLLPSEFAKEGAALRVGLEGKPESGQVVPLRLELGPQSALVALDVRSGDVLALVGSYEAVTGGLDRTRSKRQPGSAFKPVLYSYALHSRRFTPASVVEVEDKDGRRSRTIRLAVAKSDNAVAEHVLDQVGASNVVEWGHALGIESRLAPTPSLALGAYEVTPVELVTAFAVLASGGEFKPARMFERALGPGQQELELTPLPPARRVMSVEEAYLTTSLLGSVVSMGTAVSARALGRPAAGKTGTTNKARDAWFVGYSTDMVVGVWVGYDDSHPLGPGESGARTALPAWIDFMQRAHEKRPVTQFPRPAAIVVASIDPNTGLLARPDQSDAADEEFLEGTAPEVVATLDAGAADAEAGAEPSESVQEPAADASVYDPETEEPPEPAELDPAVGEDVPPF